VSKQEKKVEDHGGGVGTPGADGGEDDAQDGENHGLGPHADIFEPVGHAPELGAAQRYDRDIPVAELELCPEDILLLALTGRTCTPVCALPLTPRARPFPTFPTLLWPWPPVVVAACVACSLAALAIDLPLPMCCGGMTRTARNAVLVCASRQDETQGNQGTCNEGTCQRSSRARAPGEAPRAKKQKRKYAAKRQGDWYSIHVLYIYSGIPQAASGGCIKGTTTGGRMP
jgi:hypothetical protein